MPPIHFLSVENIIQIHDQTMEADGGLNGVRDYGLLESAMMMPQAQFGGQYLHDGVQAMAAAYLFHISQAHAFHDGNKRAAVLAALVFLDNNGYEITAANDDVAAVGLKVAAGQMGKDDVVTWTEEFTHPRR